MSKKILFLVPYPLGESPSQRFRFEHYFPILQAQGFSFRVQSFLNSQNWQVFFKQGHIIQKILALLTGFSRRWIALLQAPFYDFVFIHRETTPIGPPLMEWVMVKIFRCRIIYDFDDAIWLTDRAQESWILRVIKWRSKVGNTCRWADKVSCGNQYLADYASHFNNRVFCIPTVVDTTHWHNPELYKKSQKPDAISIVIGWTGTHSTLKYLKGLVPVLQKIESRYPEVRILVIADQKPDFDLRSLEFMPWSKSTEIEDLMKIDIGIMPLPDDEWAKGKCGFKALQYMSLKIPTIASPVGVNTVIIDHGVNGFLATTDEEWSTALEQLISDTAKRSGMGEAGQSTVVDHYSVTATASSFISLFQS
jgi:glycosyltransferase involved in cell wall biosynthesis